MSSSTKRFPLAQVTVVAAVLFLQTAAVQAQVPFQANGRALQTPQFFTPPPARPPEPPPVSPPVPPDLAEMIRNSDSELWSDPAKRKSLQQLQQQQLQHLQEQRTAPASPGFPFRITEVQGFARGAVVVDSTRLDPAAAGLFLPSAIPVKGDINNFFGAGERTTVQGQGSSVGFKWLADVGRDSANAETKVEFTSGRSGELAVTAPQAWLAWNNLLFGLTDSAFSDMRALPETIDLGGPNAQTWIKGGQAQIRYTLPPPDKDPNGFYLTASVEAPGADVYLPTTPSGAPVYSTFSRYPDFIAAVEYRSGEIVWNPCTEQNVYNELWHLQWGSVFRDLGVEKSDKSVREEAFGWGTQLTGRYTIFPNSCESLRDFLYFSVTYGNGISHYINDLHLVNPVNDAAYHWDSNTLTPLPVFACYVGITHQWLSKLRSTAVFSHVDLDSQQIKDGNTKVLPYRRGDYMSINLMYHDEPCVPDPADATKRLQHHFVAGMEYLFGQKENLSGAFGGDHRVMFMIGAAN